MPNVLAPCRNHSRQRGGTRRRLAKNISSARTYPQFRRTTEHVARTFLVSQSSRTCPHGCAALDPSSLRFAPSLFRLTGRGCAAQLAQLPRACCKLESRITTCAGRQRGCAAQAALARSSVAEDGALRYSYGPAASRGCRSSRRGTRARELCYPSVKDFRSCLFPRTISKSLKFRICGPKLMSLSPPPSLKHLRVNVFFRNKKRKRADFCFLPVRHCIAVPPALPPSCTPGGGRTDENPVADRQDTPPQARRPGAARIDGRLSGLSAARHHLSHSGSTGVRLARGQGLEAGDGRRAAGGERCACAVRSAAARAGGRTWSVGWARAQRSRRGEECHRRLFARFRRPRRAR